MAASAVRCIIERAFLALCPERFRLIELPVREHDGLGVGVPLRASPPQFEMCSLIRLAPPNSDSAGPFPLRPCLSGFPR
jgi:hypothetical protein